MIATTLLAALAASPSAVAASPHISSYPAAYFAAFQPNTALDMIGRLPGFTFDSGAAARGFADSAGNVLVDGARPASKDDDLEDVLRRIPASSVARIEVIRGGAPGIDMQGKTLLANVIRRRDIPGKLTITAALTHGLDKQISGNLLVEGEKTAGPTAYEGSFRVASLLDSRAGAGSWTRADGAGAPYVTADELSRGVERAYKATGALITPALGGNLRVTAAVAVDPYSGHQSETLRPAPGAENDHYTSETDSAELGLRHQRAIGPNLDLETVFLQRLGRLSQTDNFLGDPAAAIRTGDDTSADFFLKRHTGETIARTKVTTRPTGALTVDLGAEGDFNWLTSHTAYNENGVATALPAADVRVDELRGEVFAKAVWQASPTLNIEGGLRTEASQISSSGDVVSARSLVYVKPRLAVAWSPDRTDQVRLRAEREVGQLNFDDFTAQVAGLNTGTVHAGNPTLDPEENWVLEGTWDRRFWAGGDAAVTLRRYWLENVVDRVGVSSPSGEFDAPGNIGAGGKTEAVFTLSLPTDRLGLRRGLFTADATLRDSSVIDPTTGKARAISGLRGSDWSAHFTQGLPRWNASWSVDIWGPSIQTYYRFDEVDQDKFKSVVVLAVEHKPRGDLVVRLEALNLLGQGGEHSRIVYNGARSSAGVDFTDVHQIRTAHFLRVRIIKSFQ